ncbi:M78 family metallopeptidase domain-containing protein [Geotalea toluenoxydans]
MIKADDSTIDPPQLLAIRKHAQRALEAAAAIGKYPTPIADVMHSAQVIVVEEDVLDEGFLARVRRASGKLKQALSKVLGVLDIKARLIYLDRTLHSVKLTFLKLHETAHAVLPWQRDIYGVVEDCKQTIAPEVSENFDKEANIFASEVLFQLDDFTRQAADQSFGIKVPISLSKKYGSSIYAAVRRYVSTNHRACIVIVIDPPELVAGDGFQANLRRVVTSAGFDLTMGTLNWPKYFTPGDEIGAMIPINGRKMSYPRNCSLRDANGGLHECIAEAFTNTYQVFVLIYPVSKLSKKNVLL